MKFNIVAGEELRKTMNSMLGNPIPFNEDMSVGSYAHQPFTDEFIEERSDVHSVSPSFYKEKLRLFLEFIKAMKYDDEIHLHFGEDTTCLANRQFLINYLKDKAHKIILHIVNEYTGEEISQSIVK